MPCYKRIYVGNCYPQAYTYCPQCPNSNYPQQNNSYYPCYPHQQSPQKPRPPCNELKVCFEGIIRFM